jgi:hypothetical protein
VLRIMTVETVHRREYAMPDPVTLGALVAAALGMAAEAVGDLDRLPLQKQRPRLPREAAGGRQEQPKANRRDANPARKARAWASV